MLEPRAADVRHFATSVFVNAPMLSINRQLGFAAHRHDAVYQIGPESLRAFLSTRPLEPTERYP